MKNLFSIRLAIAVAGLALAAGCGGDDDDGGAPKTKAKPKPGVPANATVLKLTVEASPGKIVFDKKRLEAKAGPIVLELTNPTQISHNVRIEQGGKRCCQQPGAKDLGGTNTIGEGKIRGTVNLKPGTYSFFCAVGGHWQLGQRGELVVS